MKARPITAEIVCDHAESFWYKGCDFDILLHAILVVGLNLGLRYDEISKLKIEHVSVVSGNITMTLLESIKNSTVERLYQIEEWPADTKLRYSVFMDPFVAILSWLTTRGATDGYVFCDMTDNRGVCKVDTSRSLSSTKFTAILRNRLRQIGVGKSDSEMYTGHSIKRGSVQLYRSLGLRDEFVMQKIQMSGYRAYANYCAAYNNCRENDLPRFTNVKDYIEHAAQIAVESDIVYDDGAYKSFCVEVWGSEEDDGM